MDGERIDGFSRPTPVSRGVVIAGPPRPGDVWPRPPPARVVGDIFDSKPTDTHYNCPYCDATVSVRKYRTHVAKCRKLHPEIELKKCPFNACHDVKDEDYYHHICTCRDRVIMDNQVGPREFQGGRNRGGDVSAPEPNSLTLCGQYPEEIWSSVASADDDDVAAAAAAGRTGPDADYRRFQKNQLHALLYDDAFDNVKGKCGRIRRLLKRHGFVTADGGGPNLEDPEEIARLGSLIPELMPFLPSPAPVSSQPDPTGYRPVGDAVSNEGGGGEAAVVDEAEVWSQMSGSIAERVQMSHRMSESKVRRGKGRIVNLDKIHELVKSSASKVDDWVVKHFVEDREKGVWEMKPRVIKVDAEEETSVRPSAESYEEDLSIMREIFENIWKDKNVSFENVSFNLDPEMIAEYKRKKQEKADAERARRLSEEEEEEEAPGSDASTLDYCDIPAHSRVHPRSEPMKIPWRKINSENTGKITKRPEAKKPDEKVREPSDDADSNASVVGDYGAIPARSRVPSRAAPLKIPWREILSDERAEGPPTRGSAPSTRSALELIEENLPSLSISVRGYERPMAKRFESVQPLSDDEESHASVETKIQWERIRSGVDFEERPIRREVMEPDGPLSKQRGNAGNRKLQTYLVSPRDEQRGRPRSVPRGHEGGNDGGECLEPESSAAAASNPEDIAGIRPRRSYASHVTFAQIPRTARKAGDNLVKDAKSAPSVKPKRSENFNRLIAKSLEELKKHKEDLYELLRYTECD